MFRTKRLLAETLEAVQEECARLRTDYVKEVGARSAAERRAAAAEGRLEGARETIEFLRDALQRSSGEETDNMRAWAAQLATPKDEEPPTPGAVKASFFNDVVDDLSGDGPPKTGGPFVAMFNPNPPAEEPDAEA